MSVLEQIAGAYAKGVMAARSREQLELARYLASDWKSGPGAVEVICDRCEENGHAQRARETITETQPPGP